MPLTSRRTLAVLGLAGILSLSSCATLNDMATVLANLQRLKFKIAGVRDFRLVGIDIGGKAKLADFNAADVLKLGQAYTAKKLPAELVVDVLAVNPNDGTGGTTKTASTLTGLECRLLIDGRPTVTGNIDQPVEIPGTGQESAGSGPALDRPARILRDEDPHRPPQPDPGPGRPEPQRHAGRSRRPTHGLDAARADHVPRPPDHRQRRIPLSLKDPVTAVGHEDLFLSVRVTEDDRIDGDPGLGGRDIDPVEVDDLGGG